VTGTRIDELDARVVAARRGLTEKVAELRMRIETARHALSPSRYLQDPWLRLGAAVVVGYAAGAMTGSSAARAVTRRILVFAATAIVRDVLRPHEP
jgi:hypothetical protein